ncbi:MAG: lysophospholipid acyltransferase family protein [Rhodoluna sp.]|jgi:1-acyl-sn-glycerol-3-phosphate acyltransferase|nr:lysophospholipid acyltransferase family protein [Rhodoluna sp.]
MAQNDEFKMPKVATADRPFMMRVVAYILGPLVHLLFWVKLEGKEKLPKTGAYILVFNHVTHLDPLVVAYATFYGLKRGPHFLAKGNLFKVPVLGPLLLAAGQVPVYRNGRRNVEPMAAAYRFLDAGHVITIFPEGTLTREPNGWPMRGKTGSVRMAIEANVPIYSVGQWGSEVVLPTYTKKLRPKPWHKVRVLIGEEINLEKFRGRKISTEELKDATRIVMTAITKQVEILRDSKAPKKLYDPADHGQSQFGNFNKNGKK